MADSKEQVLTWASRKIAFISFGSQSLVGQAMVRLIFEMDIGDRSVVDLSTALPLSPADKVMTDHRSGYKPEVKQIISCHPNFPLVIKT